MQKIRGYVFFEDKNLSDIRNTFAEFRFDQADFSYFTSITINGDNFSCPGVFLSGEINENYDRDYIVKLFRKILNLSDDPKHHNLSLSGKDELRPILTDRLYGCYSCLVFASSSNPDNVELLAEEIKRMLNPRDLWLRTVSRQKVEDNLCIDMVGERFFDQHASELNNYISGLGLVIEQNSSINLIK